MTDLLDEAFEVVNAKGPNAELIAKLGCELERARAKNYRLDVENRNVRRSYSRLKRFFTRQFKYYKAHRDELLNEKSSKIRVDIVLQNKRSGLVHEEGSIQRSSQFNSLPRSKSKTKLEQHRIIQ